MQEQFLDTLFSIFHPYTFIRHREASNNNRRFVHYTSAEVAMSIITHKEIWMRNTTCMNDFSEVQYGNHCLQEAYYKSLDGEKFRNTLNGIFPGISTEIEFLFNSWVPNVQSDTYLTCVSEHVDDEDTLGRLSMWRAYGNPLGVALVFKKEALLSPSSALKAYPSPVIYTDANGVKEQLNLITNGILKNTGTIQSMGREAIKGYVFHAFKLAIVSIKHQGFKEEQEWRMVYIPSMEPEPSAIIKKDIRAVNGVPQQIYRIPLIDTPEIDYYASVASILDRIIIGPVQYPGAVYKAFVELLANAGVPEPQNKVFVSNIPLRQ